MIRWLENERTDRRSEASQEMAIIFLTGGAFEGKTAYAKKKYPDARIISDYHQTVRRQLENGMGPEKEIRRLLRSLREKTETTVIISDEIGCGIIPLDPMERKWRESNGRVNCLIAAEADSVIRILAGIPQKLK